MEQSQDKSNEAPGQLRQGGVVPSAPLVLRHSGDEDDGYDADEWMDEEDWDEVIIGYECLGCGHTQATDGWGGRCDRCDGLSLEAMYY